jgi:predicted alpha/beta-fold hydrolase
MTKFAPAWFLPGPHLQTVWGRITRSRRAVTFRRELLETPDGDEIVLDHVDRRVDSPLHFVLMHGLEGSSYSVYVQGVLAALARHGHGATAINFRSCARDPRNLSVMLPNRRPRFYHSGETGDFDCVVRTLAARMPDRRFAAFGASLGGNVLLKWLGENPEQSIVAAAATLSVPFDLARGARLLETTAAGRFYVARFLTTLKKKMLRPDVMPLLDMPAVLRSRSFYEYDDVATAPLHGFAGAEDYYAKSSSLHFVDRIRTPTLALNAEDDPFVPAEILPLVREASSSAVDFRTTPAGGHVGFVGGGAPWKCEYWAEETVVRWLVDKLRIED